MNSPLDQLHAQAGALTGDVGGVILPRHYGDPSAEYRAAVEGVAVIDAAFTVRLGVTGRQPAEMITGVITNSIPDLLGASSPQVFAGHSAYAALLTPKGRMLTDLQVGWVGTDAEQGLLLELPIAGAEAALAHFGKFIPPRLARIEDRSGELSAIRVVGPGAPELLERVALGLRVERETLTAMAESDVLAVGSHPAAGIRLRRLGDLATPAWEAVADHSTIRGLWSGLEAAGAVRAGHAVHEALRVEGGQPAWGRDMDEATIPVEAGIAPRAIDYNKGCYTGQETIVRLRDRGRVNRHLRGLLFGDGPAVAPGTTLHREGEEKTLGIVTSEADSPRAGQSIGLGYVRREVEVPGTLRAGAPEGPAVQVRELSGPDWAF